MIRSIDIPHFGVFKEFSWNECLQDSDGNPLQFKRMNIIYGRNYSGKTTLSRIVRSLETGQLSQRFERPDFAITTDVGVFTPANLGEAPLDVRVYNRDFVLENLSFLTDESGEISPFAVIGKDNTKLEQEIRVLETRLGTEDPPTGLRKSHGEAAEILARARTDERAAREGLEAKLSDKANRRAGGIKHDPLFRDPTYNIVKLRQDISAVRSSKRETLDDEVREDLRRVLSEQGLPDINWDVEFSPSYPDLLRATSDLLLRVLLPRSPVRDLLSDLELQNWVKHGVPLHRNRRETCGFCDSQLTNASWTRLDEHFDEASSAFESDIDVCVREIDSEMTRMSSIQMVELDSLYESLRPRARVARAALSEALSNYSRSLGTLKTALLERKKDLFNPRELKSEGGDLSGPLSDAIAQCGAIVEEHNRKSGTLAKDQNEASASLRLDEVLRFIVDIDIESEERRIQECVSALSTAQATRDTLGNQVMALESELDGLRQRLTNESLGAEKVNQYLTHYFGHESLRLEAVDGPNGTGSLFKVFRGRVPAYNLSEGECSLVAFCYFIARLEAVDAVGKELVIFIDDPISSLDENHIFFIYSLIEATIARRRRDANGDDIKDANGRASFRYRQLFVATHNLDFLKYCKRLDRPKKDCAHFMVRHRAAGSMIEEMPPYLRDYVTEFNFLFDEICVCVDPANATDRKHSFYSFGNNLRKFLEAYLFFKYPVSMGERESHQRRVERFFQGEEATEPLVQRVVNELSHLAERFDRSVQPVDIPEINKIAAFVLEAIRRRDPDQYTCLLESVGRDDPLQLLN